MSDTDAPKFRWGQPVQSVTDLFNDGTFPDWPKDALLVPTGDRGEIVQIGAHVESRTTIYLVEFSAHRVVGCLEDEIAALPETQPATSTESQLR